MWIGRLKDQYETKQEFKSYAETYSLADRLKFNSIDALWRANPVVCGSANPSDYRVIPLKELKEGDAEAFKRLNAMSDEEKHQMIDAAIDDGYDGVNFYVLVETLNREFNGCPPVAFTGTVDCSMPNSVALLEAWCDAHMAMCPDLMPAAR